MLTNTIKKIFYYLPFFKRPRPVVLMYHSISDKEAFFVVKESEFEKQMKYLMETGREVVSLSEIIRRKKNGENIENLIAITFDDGYLDNYTNAFPILRKYNFKSTIFSITGLIGGERKVLNESFSMLSLENMREMEKTGLVEFMPHTHNHQNLNELDEKSQKIEISSSRDFLERELGGKRNVFAYPKGRFTVESIKYLGEMGFVGAVSVVPGDLFGKLDDFIIPRQSVDSKVDLRVFIVTVSIGGYLIDKVKSFFKR